MTIVDPLTRKPIVIFSLQDLEAMRDLTKGQDRLHRVKSIRELTGVGLGLAVTLADAFLFIEQAEREGENATATESQVSPTELQQ